MSRWIIVSNRLPFSIDQKTQRLQQSSGGLVTAINGIQTKEHIHWIGSLAPGIKKNHILNYKNKEGVSFSYPKISQELYESYYNGFCNDVLWPILHYETEIIKFSHQHYLDYIKVNKLFAEHIAKTAKKDDVIWINDFHLFMVPKFLKKLKPNLKIGFFLHVPFPSSEVYRELPCRKELLEALLYSDLIGFHDFSYLRHFASSVYNILGYESSLLDIKTPFNTAKLGVYPVSINSQDFIKKSKSLKTQKTIKEYGFDKNKKRIILGVDRLDYTKGIPHKLKAFKKYLENNPQMVGKVQLIQIAVPSRTEVPEYINLRHEVERLVSEINGKFSKLNYVPVKYIFDSVSIYELMALYKSSDVLFITSKRDGMNLVCLEYIVTQDPKKPGVVLLSEFAGASSTLSHATIINPMNIDETAQKLEDALNMPIKQKINNHQIMFHYLLEYTATVWAKSFITHLNDQESSLQSGVKNLQNKKHLVDLRKQFKAKKHVLLLDFDGTLAPIIDTPSEVKLSSKNYNLMKKLITKNEVVIVTGRDKKFIQKQVKGLDVYIACEHGASFYDYKTKKWRSLAASTRKPWMKEALAIMSQYQKRTPSSFIEKKDHAICWHYRKSPNDFAEFQARKLVIDLETTFSHEPVSVNQGKKIVETKALEANKGYFTEWFLSRYIDDDHDIIAIGDDRTDEDMFRALENIGTSIKVGAPKNTYAKYFIEDQKDVTQIIQDLIII
jgi:trehalose 6-phosphate synthase/phosphatase